MAKRRTLYMHTVNRGLPAYWCERDQVIYWCTRGHRVTLHRSLAEIRRQQRVSRATRIRMGYADDGAYGYALVEAPRAC